MSDRLSPDALRRLELAQRAWRADAPSPAEVSRAVRRVAVARRRRRTPGAGPVAGAVLALAALAFAAQHGALALRRAPNSPPPSPAKHMTTAASALTAPVPSALTAPVPSALTAPVPSALTAPAPSALTAPAPSALTAPAPSALTAPAPSAAPVEAPPMSRPTASAAASISVAKELPRRKPPASWRDVNRALERGNTKAAARWLKQLERSADPSTRAKAQLGLAQLAAAVGHCARAKHLAEQAQRAPGAGAELAGHARSILRNCQPH